MTMAHLGEQHSAVNKTTPSSSSSVDIPGAAGTAGRKDSDSNLNFLSSTITHSISGSSLPNLTAMEFHESLPKLNYRFDVDNAQKSAKILLREFRPDLQHLLDNEELILKEFTGGVTNKLLAAYFASDKANKTLIRVYGAETDKIIDRAAEIRTLMTLHEHECCGKLFGVFENGMCYQFVTGQPLNLSMVRDEHISRLVIRELVQLHCVYRGGGVNGAKGASQAAAVGKQELFDPFAKMSSFLELIPTSFENKEKQRRFEKYYPPREVFAKEIATLKEHLTGPEIRSPKVFCHNDLLCANILYDKEKDSVSFIDFEYAGLNYQAYDLANYFNEFAGVEDCDYSRYPSREYQISWLRYYLQCWNKAHATAGQGEGDEPLVTDQQLESLYAAVQKFTLASHLLWILWCVIQAEHSEIHFDFLQYGKIRFDEYCRRKEELLGLKVASP